MAIEFKCSGCDRPLRVSDDQAGRQAKCPVCEQLTTIPSPFDADAEPVEASESPDAAPSVTQPAMGTPSGTTMRPHRGVSILVFGICSVFCCGLLGIAAWVMANEDLALMDRGLMDPSGRGMAMAGKVLGIIGLVILMAGAVAQVSLNV